MCPYLDMHEKSWSPNSNHSHPFAFLLLEECSLITKMYTNCQFETVTYGPCKPSVWFSQTFTVKVFQNSKTPSETVVYKSTKAQKQDIHISHDKIYMLGQLESRVRCTEWCMIDFWSWAKALNSSDNWAMPCLRKPDRGSVTHRQCHTIESAVIKVISHHICMSFLYGEEYRIY